MEVYVVQHDGTEERKWQYHMQCNPIPVTTILISTIGTFFAVCLGLLISAVVVININDYRSYKKYLENKKEAEGLMAQMKTSTNPEHQSPVQFFENPAHGK